jgi:uncharacterized protein
MKYYIDDRGYYLGASDTPLSEYEVPFPPEISTQVWDGKEWLGRNDELKKVYREQAIKLDSTQVDGSGYLRTRAKIARIGILDYYEDGKVVRELKSPEAVQESAATFARLPVTLDHPPDMVFSDNAHKYEKGLTGDAVDYEDGWLVTNITVTHADAVAASGSTHQELSCGYYALLIDSPGAWVDELGVMGEKGQMHSYDRIQHQIEGNHVALVQRARAGRGATFCNGDSIITQADGRGLGDLPHKRPVQENESTVQTMVQIVYKNDVFTIDGADAEKIKSVFLQVNEDLTKEKNDSADLLSEIEELKSKVSSLQGKIDGLEADRSGIDREVIDRIKAWSLVSPHLDADFTPDYSLDAKGIKSLWLKQALPELKSKIDSGDDNYIEALWDIKQPKRSPKNDGLRDAISGTATPKLDTIDEARQKYIEARKFK